MGKKKLLVFHPTIAPYRIDFFNDLYQSFDTNICLQYKNLKSQKFDYDTIRNQFAFTPTYMPESSRLKLIKAVWQQIRSFAPDVVITCEFNLITIFAVLWRYVAKKKYKVVVMCDDSYDMVVGGNDFSSRHRKARNILSRCIDEIILVDKRVQLWYQAKYHIGLFFPIIKNEDKARDNYKQALQLQPSIIQAYGLEGKNVFLFVGRLVKIKNVDTVIRAFAKLEQNRNALVIVGAGPEDESLKLLAKEKRVNTIFTGRLEGISLNVWYVIAKCFVLASYQEAFGAVTNEALLAGCYALISSKAGSSCLIEDGVNGYVFDPKNLDDLVCKMHKIEGMSPVQIENDGVRENMMRLNYFEMMRVLTAKLSSI